MISFLLNVRFSENNVTPNHIFIRVAGDVAKVLNLIDDPEKAQAFTKLLNKYGVDIAKVRVNEWSDADFTVDKEKVAALFKPDSSDAVMLSDKSGVAIVGIPIVDKEKAALIIKIDFSSSLITFRRNVFLHF